MVVEARIVELHADRVLLLLVAQLPQVHEHERLVQPEAHALGPRGDDDRVAGGHELLGDMILDVLLEVGRLVDAVDEQDQASHRVELLEHRERRLVEGALAAFAPGVEEDEVGRWERAVRLRLAHQPRELLHVHYEWRQLEPCRVLRAAAPEVAEPRRDALGDVRALIVERQRVAASGEQVEQLHYAPGLARARARPYQDGLRALPPVPPACPRPHQERMERAHVGDGALVGERGRVLWSAVLGEVDRLAGASLDPLEHNRACRRERRVGEIERARAQRDAA